MKSEDLERRLLVIFSKLQDGRKLKGLEYEEGILSSFLIQNLRKRNKSWSLRECVIADYVNLELPVHASRLLEKCNEILSKKVIISNKTLEENNQNPEGINYRMASKAYLQFLKHPDSRKLITQACDVEDLKAIAYIDVLLDRLGMVKCQPVVQSGACIEGKVKQLAEVYNRDTVYKRVIEEATKIRGKYRNEYEDLIKGSLSKEKVQKFSAIQQELLNILMKWDSLPSNIIQEIHSEYGHIRDLAIKIDSVFKKHEMNVDRRFKEVDNEFRNSTWNTNTRIEKLDNLRSKIKDIQEEYNIIFSQQGIKKCNSLDSEIKNIVKNHRAIKYVKEDLIDKKYTIRDYKKEINEIFKDLVTYSEINRLNKIYSDLICYKNQEYDENIVSKEQLDEHDQRIDDVLCYLKNKADGRREALKRKCDLYIGRKNSLWTNLYHKFSVYNKKKLEKAWEELEEWKRCRIP